MKLEEFKRLIKSIGFKKDDYGYYQYKEFRIDLSVYFYYFYIGSEWVLYKYNDLEPIYNNFKNELRSYKLKQLLR